MSPRVNKSQSHLLHVMPSFGPGGAQVRTVQLMNQLGDSFRHTVVSLSGDFAASDRVDSSVGVRYLPCQKSCNPISMARRLAGVLAAEQPHLLLTYNWGAIDAVVAARCRPSIPLIHTEDGFGADEANRQKRRRALFRRIMLPGAYRVVAPSHSLAAIMRDAWKLPAEKVTYIPNGVDVDAFRPVGRGPRRELVVGTVGHLRPEKSYGDLMHACARLSLEMPVRLLIVGDGPERAALTEKARALHLQDRVTFLGRQKDTARLYHDMDLFALCSRTEQMPLAVLEAMASGLPVVATDVGDLREMVSAVNQRFIVSGAKEYQGALEEMAANGALRCAIGAANRQKCLQFYSLRGMLSRYAALFEEAVRIGWKGPICH